MKKCLLSIMLFGVLSVFISCGNKNEQKENENNCSFAEMNFGTTDLDNIENLKELHKKGSKELFTGNCFLKDQYDSIIRKFEVKNGWIIKEIKREKILKNYVTIFNYDYENLKKNNGWEIYVNKGENLDLFKGYFYVNNYLELKNGKEYNKWKIYLSTDGQYTITTTIELKNGIELSDNEQIQPKCMIGSEKDGEYLSIGGGEQYQQIKDSYTLKDISPKDFFKTIGCLKGEFIKFDFWNINPDIVSNIDKIKVTQTNEINNAEQESQGGPAGEIVVGIKDKIYFYDSSNSTSITSSYFVKGQKAEFFEISDDNLEDDFLYVNFEHNGKVKAGYVLRSDVKFE